MVRVRRKVTFAIRGVWTPPNQIGFVYWCAAALLLPVYIYMHGGDAGHWGSEWHFLVHLIAALTITETAFESHEKTKQDHFFTLTSIWHSVEILDGGQQMTMHWRLWMCITGKDTGGIWHCSCLVSNVCAGWKHLWYLQARVCVLLCVHQSCLTYNWLHNKSIFLCKVQCTMQCQKENDLLACVRLS